MKSLYHKGLHASVRTVRVGAPVVNPQSEGTPTERQKEASNLADNSPKNFVLIDFDPNGFLTLSQFDTRKELDDAFFTLASQNKPHKYVALFDKTTSNWQNTKSAENDFGSDVLTIAVRESADPKPASGKSSTGEPELEHPESHSTREQPKNQPTIVRKVVRKNTTVNNTGFWWVLGGVGAGLGLLWFSKRKKTV